MVIVMWVRMCAIWAGHSKAPTPGPAHSYSWLEGCYWKIAVKIEKTSFFGSFWYGFHELRTCCTHCHQIRSTYWLILFCMSGVRKHMRFFQRLWQKPSSSASCWPIQILYVCLESSDAAGSANPVIIKSPRIFRPSHVFWCFSFRLSLCHAVLYSIPAGTSCIVIWSASSIINTSQRKKKFKNHSSYKLLVAPR